MRGQRIEEKLDDVAKYLSRLDAMLVVREPNTVYAAEVYEGLRKSIQFASQQQRIHLSTLISLLDDLAAGATLETIGLRIRDRLTEAGVQQVTDEARFPEAFVESDSSTFTRPAWILFSSDQSEIVVRPGTRHRQIPLEIDRSQAEGVSSESHDKEETSTEVDYDPPNREDIKEHREGSSQ